MNQHRRGILLGIAVLAVVLVLSLMTRSKPVKILPPPVSAPAPAAVSSQTHVLVATNGLGSITKRRAEFTPDEWEDLTNRFEKSFKPAIERWCKIYEERLPFKASDVTLDKFHSRLGGFLYTFMIGSTTFTIADTKNGTRVFYMMTREASTALNSIPSGGAPSNVAMPVSRPVIVGLIKEDSGIDYPADQISLHPTGQFSAISGGVMVEAGGITGNTVFRAMTATNLDFVLNGNGKMVSYQH